MWGKILFGVFGATVGAVIAAYVVPNYLAPQPDSTPVVTEMDTAMQMTDDSDSSMTMDQMTDELAQLDGEAFDLAFLELMIEHHRGALDMAALVDERSENPELQSFAAEIITAQDAEIEQMLEWQAALATQSAQIAE